MTRRLTGSIAALAMIGAVLASAPAGAQWRDHDRDGRPDAGRQDQNRDGRPDRMDQMGRHDDRRDDRRDYRSDQHRWRYYGGQYGYDGYHGRWRAGQRYPDWRDRGRYISDYRAYGLPAPRPGYRYYRDDNGDIVMAAVASGVIGLIIGGALAR